MFFVYYGFKGQLLDVTVRNFQKLRPNPQEEIKFEEFSRLMDTLALKPALQDRIPAPPKRRRLMPKFSRTPRTCRNLGATCDSEGLPLVRGAQTARSTYPSMPWNSPYGKVALAPQISPRYKVMMAKPGAGMSPPGSISALT